MANKSLAWLPLIRYYDDDDDDDNNNPDSGCLVWLCSKNASNCVVQRRRRRRSASLRAAQTDRRAACVGCTASERTSAIRHASRFLGYGRAGWLAELACRCATSRGCRCCCRSGGASNVVATCDRLTASCNLQFANAPTQLTGEPKRVAQLARAVINLHLTAARSSGSLIGSNGSMPLADGIGLTLALARPRPRLKLKQSVRQTALHQPSGKLVAPLKQSLPVKHETCCPSLLLYFYLFAFASFVVHQGPQNKATATKSTHKQTNLFAKHIN